MAYAWCATTAAIECAKTAATAQLVACAWGVWCMCFIFKCHSRKVCNKHQLTLVANAMQGTCLRASFFLLFSACGRPQVNEIAIAYVMQSSQLSLSLSLSLCSGELRLKSNCKCQQVNLTFFISWSWAGKDFIYFDNKNRIQLTWELIASSSYTQPKLNYRESLLPAFLPLSTNSSPRTH